MGRTAAVLLAAALAAFVPARSPALEPAGGGIRDARADLIRLQAELRGSEQALRRQSRQERAEVDVLERLDRELAATRRDARVHRHNLGLVLDRLRAIAAATARLEDEEDADRAFLKADLVALYKAGAASLPSLPLPGEDGSRARLRARYLEALAAAASRRMDALGSDLRQLDAYRSEFDARYLELRLSMSRVEDARRQVERERVGNERRLRRVRVGEAHSEEDVRRIRSAADRLQGMLSALQSAARRRERAQARAEALAEERARGEEGGAAAPAAPARWTRPPRFRGRGLGRALPWPVPGGLLSRFGKHLHPVFHIPVFNRGVEISADLGAPVRVVAAGVVDFAGALEGFGELVVVDHGRGMLSVYGYGSRLRVREGQVLRGGDVVEDAGRAPSSGRPCLYFEIRKGAKAQDPLDYLARR